MTTKYYHDYPVSVIKAIQEYQEFHEYNVMTWEQIQEQTPEWVLRTYLEWEGIIGYSETIINILYADPGDKPGKF